MAQDFFAAFGHDGIGTIGTPTTINSGDMAGVLMIAVQALEKQNRDLRAENAQVRPGSTPWKDWYSQRRRWRRSNAYKFSTSLRALSTSAMRTSGRVPARFGL